MLKIFNSFYYPQLVFDIILLRPFEQGMHSLIFCKQLLTIGAWLIYLQMFSMDFCARRGGRAICHVFIVTASCGPTRLKQIS